MRRMSKFFAPLATFGTAVAVFLTSNPAFAQAMDATRADRDKWLGLGAALAIGLSALGGGVRAARPDRPSRASRATRRRRTRSSRR